MVSLNKLNKRGISEMVGYVLLIVIAVGLSVLVFSYLRVYIPKEKPECSSDINIIVQGYSCKNKEFNVTLSNKGLFKINAVYIRFGTEAQKVKSWLNDPKKVSRENFYMDILPGNSKTTSSFTLTAEPGSYEVEIQPAVYQKNVDENAETSELVLCEKAVVTQPVICT